MKGTKSQFIDAVFKNDMRKMQSLIKAGGNINEIDADGRSALHHAIIGENPAFVRILLDAGADARIADGNGWTPLHFAVRNKSVDIAKWLIDSGADVNAMDVHGNSVLARAVFESKGRGEMIALLLQAGADRDQKNKHGVSAFELACTIENYDVRQWFKSAKETEQ